MLYITVPANGASLKSPCGFVVLVVVWVVYFFALFIFFEVGFALFVFILHGRGCLVHSLKVDKQAKLDFIHLLADNFSKD